jgi:hypothetical protein
MKPHKLNIKANTYNFFGIRKFKIPAPHFDYICVPYRYNMDKSVEKWINDNLKGRYYIGKSYELDQTKQANNVLKVGFEEAKELSYFTLACPHLKYY